MSRSSIKISHLNIWFVLGLALFLRTLLRVVGYCYTRDATIFYTPDSASYIVPARELIAHHRFFSDGSLQAAVWNKPVAAAPDTVRTPGYPLLLTAGLLCGRLESVTIALQIVLSCFTVCIVFRTALLLFESEQIALIAAAFYAIEPLSILFSSLLVPETLFTAVLMTGVYYFLRYLKRQSLDPLVLETAELIQKNQGLVSKTSCCIENTEPVLPTSRPAGSSALHWLAFLMAHATFNPLRQRVLFA